MMKTIFFYKIDLKYLNIWLAQMTYKLNLSSFALGNITWLCAQRFILGGAQWAICDAEDLIWPPGGKSCALAL